MPIQTTCPQCGRGYAVPEDLAGQTGSCACGATFPIPPAPLRRPAIAIPGAVRLASVRQLAAEQWPVLRQRAAPALRLVLARPWLPAALAAWLVSFLLIPLHNRLHMASRWPDNIMLLVADVWVYATVATLAIIVSRRLMARPVRPAIGFLSGYACGLLLLVVHGLSLASHGLHWLSPWSSYGALRHFTAFAVGLVAGEAAVWVPFPLDPPPAVPGAARPRPDLLRPYLKQLQVVGLILAWLTPSLLTIGLHTHFRALPTKPWTRPSQAALYWLALLLMPALFGLWTARRRWLRRPVVCGPLFAFVGVQWGLLGALTIWPYPSWQRETAIGLSAFLGLVGLGLAIVTVPQAPGLLAPRARRGLALALAAVGVALGTFYARGPLFGGGLAGSAEMVPTWARVLLVVGWLALTVHRIRKERSRAAAA